MHNKVSFIWKDLKVDARPSLHVANVVIIAPSALAKRTISGPR